jgi:hypothetical protein
MEKPLINTNPRRSMWISPGIETARARMAPGILGWLGVGQSVFGIEIDQSTFSALLRAVHVH